MKTLQTLCIRGKLYCCLDLNITEVLILQDCMLEMT